MPAQSAGDHLPQPTQTQSKFLLTVANFSSVPGSLWHCPPQTRPENCPLVIQPPPPRLASPSFKAGQRHTAQCIAQPQPRGAHTLAALHGRRWSHTPLLSIGPPGLRRTVQGRTPAYTCTCVHICGPPSAPREQPPEKHQLLLFWQILIAQGPSFTDGPSKGSTSEAGKFGCAEKKLLPPPPWAGTWSVHPGVEPGATKSETANTANYAKNFTKKFSWPAQI